MAGEGGPARGKSFCFKVKSSVGSLLRSCFGILVNTQEVVALI